MSHVQKGSFPGNLVGDNVCWDTSVLSRAALETSGEGKQNDVTETCGEEGGITDLGDVRRLRQAWKRVSVSGQRGDSGSVVPVVSKATPGKR